MSFLSSVLHFYSLKRIILLLMRLFDRSSRKVYTKDNYSFRICNSIKKIVISLHVLYFYIFITFSILLQTFTKVIKVLQRCFMLTSSILKKEINLYTFGTTYQTLNDGLWTLNDGDFFYIHSSSFSSFSYRRGKRHSINH